MMADVSVIQRQILDEDGESGWRLLNQFYFSGGISAKRAQAKRSTLSTNTRRAYISDLRSVCEHLRYSEPVPLSVDALIDYIEERGPLTQETASLLRQKGLTGTSIDDIQRARLSAQTVRRHMAAVKHVHRMAGYPDPTDNPDVQGAIKRAFDSQRRLRKPRRGPSPALPLTALLLAAQRGLNDDTVIDTRDRAFLLIGFWGAFRQSELSALQFDQFSETPAGGLAVEMGETKNYKGDFQPVYKHLPLRAGMDLCPVTAYREWKAALGVSSGHVFRGRVSRHDHTFQDRALSENGCNRILRTRLALAGVPNAESYSCHSLRAGFVTAGAEMGAPNSYLMSQTHHKDERSLSGYVRLAELAKKDVAGKMMDIFASGEATSLPISQQNRLLSEIRNKK